MSIETAKAFLAHAEENAELRDELGQLRGPQALDQLVEIAATHGYTFSLDDYRSAVIEAAQGELSDAALRDTLDGAGFLKQDLDQ